MNSIYENTRKIYKPIKVRILLIGESPPEGETFFYNKNSLLFDYTKKAFQSALSRSFLDQAFLDYLKDSGVYLDDLCLTPINKVEKTKRKKAHRENIIPFSEKIKNYNPEILISVIKGIHKSLRKSIELAGLGKSPYYSLPFPSFGNQQKYVKELVPIIQNLSAKYFS